MNHHNSKQLIGMISTNSQFNIEQKNLEEDKIEKNPTLNFLNNIYSLNISNQSYVVVQCYDDIKLNEITDITEQVNFFFDSCVNRKIE